METTSRNSSSGLEETDIIISGPAATANSELKNIEIFVRAYSKGSATG